MSQSSRSGAGEASEGRARLPAERPPKNRKSLRSGRDILQERDSGWCAGQAMEPAAEQRNRSSEMEIEARSQATEISGQRPPPPTPTRGQPLVQACDVDPERLRAKSSVRSAMFIATTTP